MYTFLCVSGQEQKEFVKNVSFPKSLESRVWRLMERDLSFARGS